MFVDLSKRDWYEHELRRIDSERKVMDKRGFDLMFVILMG